MGSPMPIAWAGLLEAFVVVMVSEKLILYPSIVYTPHDLVNRLRVSEDRSIVIPEKREDQMVAAAWHRPGPDAKRVASPARHHAAPGGLKRSSLDAQPR